MNTRYQFSDYRYKIAALLTSLLVSSIYSLSSPTSAHAQSVGLSISPPVVEILLAPNKKVVQTFTLKNQGESVIITPNLREVKPIDQYGHVAVSSNEINPANMPLGAKLSPLGLGNSITLAGGDTTALTLSLEGATVDAPIDTYLALVIEASPVNNSYHLTAAKPGISALVLVTLTPSAVIPANLEIADFNPPLFHDSTLPFVLTPTLKNNSSIMLRPRGKLQILGSNDHVLYELSFYKNLLLKESKRIIEGSTQSDPPLVTPLSWEPNWTNFGPLRVRLSVETEGGTKLTEIEKVVWFLPIRAIIAITLLAVIMIVLIVFKAKPPKAPLDQAEN